jgi:hypothetical protein
MIDPPAEGRPISKPYTEIGIRRLKCFRCRKRRARFQWQICSDGNRWRPLCEICDVALNAAVLAFVGMSARDRARKMRIYRAEKLGQ